jgi:GPH family glycoside/pentoside/hexuronide:cation symporter
MTIEMDTADAVATPRRTFAAAAPASRISTGLALGFGVGTVGVSILLNTVTIYLPVMLATVLGVAPAIAGYLVMGSRLYDILVDFVVGAVSDRTRSPWGRRRPYMLAGTLIGVAAMIFLFNAPGVVGPALIATLAAAFVIYATGYSLFNVPYLAMPSEITDDYNERTRFLSFRTAFIAVGQLISISLSAWLIAKFGGDRSAFNKLGYIMGAIALASMMICFFSTHSARRLEPDDRHALSLFGHIRLTLRNRPFVLLMLSKFLILLATATNSTAMLLYMLNVLKGGYQGALYMNLGVNLALALSMPFWVPLARKIGKRKSYMAAMVIYVLSMASWIFAQPHEPMIGLVVRGVLHGVAAGGMGLVGLAMLPDTVEYDALRFGLRREGLFSSVFAVMEKLGFAIGPGLMGMYLTASGYVPTHHGHLTTQPPAVATALLVGSALIPAALVLGAFAAMVFYDLDQAKLKAMAAAASPTV